MKNNNHNNNNNYIRNNNEELNDIILNLDISNDCNSNSNLSSTSGINESNNSSTLSCNKMNNNNCNFKNNNNKIINDEFDKNKINNNNCDINNNHNKYETYGNDNNIVNTGNGANSVSLYLEKNKDKKKVNTESLRGPIIFQNFILYTFFLIVIGTAEGTGWAPEIRVANFVPYCVMCIVLLEFNRLHRKPLLRIIFPLYTSNILFAYVCIFSREAHVLISFLFFASCLCIFLQSGIPDLRKHIIIFCIIFMINYACCILFMEWFYVDTTGTKAFRGRVLSTKIHWGQEATILVGMALLGGIFIVLEKFIKSYARHVAKQHYEIQCLKKEKEKLQSEIIFSLNKFDLDTPIEKIITILRSMINTSESENDKKQLFKVIAVLGSNKLYDPDFNFENCTDDVDVEVYSWLQSMLNREVGNGNDYHPSAKHPHLLNYSGTSNYNFPSPNLLKKLTNSEILLRTTKSLSETTNQEIQDLIDSNILGWDFPVFELDRITDGNPLFYMSFYIFSRHKFFQKYKIGLDIFKNFMRKIEKGYDSNNPYHNSIHATDVLQNLNFFIEKSVGKFLTEVEIFSMLLAAIVHDFKHPGQNNHFQINSKSKLAIRYNDKSILENFHLHQAFIIMNEKESGILLNLPEPLRKEIRENIIALVLSTDMAKHFTLVGRFKSMINSSTAANSSSSISTNTTTTTPTIPTSTNAQGGSYSACSTTLNSTPQTTSVSSSSTASTANVSSPSINCNNTITTPPAPPTHFNYSCFLNGTKKDRLLLMKIAIKCADVSNPSKPWHLYEIWSKRVTEEFYKQGDEEKLRNMDISAFMDRNKPTQTTKCQINFINIFVNPLYEVWSQFFPEFKICHQNVVSNLERLNLESSDQLNNNSSNNSNSVSNSNNSNSFGLSQSNYLAVH